MEAPRKINCVIAINRFREQMLYQCHKGIAGSKSKKPGIG